MMFQHTEVNNPIINVTESLSHNNQYLPLSDQILVNLDDIFLEKKKDEPE